MLTIAALSGLPVCSPPAIAQESTPQQEYLREDIRQRDFERNAWQEAINGIDYSPKTKKKKTEKKEKSRENAGDRYPQRRNSESSESSLGTFLMKALIIAGAVVILALLLRSLLGMGGFPKISLWRKRQPGAPWDIEKIEDHLHETDLEQFIRQAILQGDFASAIRLYYLAMLKELSARRIIKWKKDKTNRDYLREMQGSVLYAPFREVTAVFEQVWYGESMLEEKEFRELEPAFVKLIKQIKE